MRPACLFRNIGDEYPDEIKSCSKYFDILPNIGLLLTGNPDKKPRKLLAKYSVLQFYKEVETSVYAING